MREIAVFGGTAHPALAAEICADLGVPQRPARFTRFAKPLVRGRGVEPRPVRLLMSLDLADGSGASAAEPPG